MGSRAGIMDHVIWEGCSTPGTHHMPRVQRPWGIGCRAQYTWHTPRAKGAAPVRGGGVQRLASPFGGIVPDVGPGVFPLPGSSDDAFEIISLPYGSDSGDLPVDGPG